MIMALTLKVIRNYQSVSISGEVSITILFIFLKLMVFIKMTFLKKLRAKPPK